MTSDWRTAFGWRIPAGIQARGRVRVPGDKSISHRSVILTSLAEGTSRIRGFLAGEDSLCTARSFAQMGVRIDGLGTTELVVHGAGRGGLQTPTADLDMGNAGTGMRLMAGTLAGQGVACTITGDASLRRRPMRRIIEPLRQMGAQIAAQGAGDTAPLRLTPATLHGIDYRSPVASAQVKSCLLLAGLGAGGTTRVHEPALSRDHTERMLPQFGVALEVLADGAAVAGGQTLRACDVDVAADISSAAFFLVAGALSDGATLTIEGVGINPTRTGILDCLAAMGAELTIANQRPQSGEPVADVTVRGGALRGTEIGGELLLRALDEFPILAVAAAFADGTTVFRDAQELRVKESDRIAAMEAALTRIGADVQAHPDGMTVRGRPRLAGGRIASRGDHRVAMALAVAASRCMGPVEVEDVACVATSFPGFLELLEEATR
jgi:3-phosphoshikimate 1-carboxyvinyltransferase